MEHQERDLFKHPLSTDEIRRVLRGRSVADVFATRSPTFKALGLGERALDDDARLALMVEYPQLIRRPLIVVGDELVVGFDPKWLEAVLR